MPRMTLSEFNAHEARMRAKAGVFETHSDSGVEKESELHRDILEFCKGRKWIALHGSMAHATGRTVGEYDFIIQADGGRAFWIECKTRTGKLSVEQQALHHWAKTLGHEPHVVRSMEEFLKVVENPQLTSSPISS